MSTVRKTRQCRSKKYRGIQNFERNCHETKDKRQIYERVCLSAVLHPKFVNRVVHGLWKVWKPRNFESKTLTEIERAKAQLLHYISIFHFATLGRLLMPFITKFYFRTTAFLQQRLEVTFRATASLQQRLEVTSEFRLGVVGRERYMNWQLDVPTE